MRKFAPGIGARVVVISLIPSMVLLVAGIAVASTAVTQGLRDRSWADGFLQAAPALTDLTEALQHERRLTLLRVAGAPVAPEEILRARGQVFASVELISAAKTLSEATAGSLDAAMGGVAEQLRNLDMLRSRVDHGLAEVNEVYDTFNTLMNNFSGINLLLARGAPDAAAAVDEAIANSLFQAIESLSRGHALAAATYAEGTLPAEHWREFVRCVDHYRSELADVIPKVSPRTREEIETLTSSPAWLRLVEIEDSAMVQVGDALGGTLAGTIDTKDRQVLTGLGKTDRMMWQSIAVDGQAGLLALWRADFDRNHLAANDAAVIKARNSILAGALILLISISVTIISVVMSNRLVRRLRGLRKETLNLADRGLPGMMERIHAGEPVDISSELAILDFGRDEIGQVAEAFNRSQAVALASAVTEAKTRKAVNAVFLNIAHRSQTVIHRQLEILDRAEAVEENPAYLELLFQLDHLATRARRNAENLIILGGERPGRRWRLPVPLMTIVRSAIGESQDYSRVEMGRLPDISVAGGVVADLVHLLAELVDNAASFSPPESKIEAAGSIVGKGVIVEIVDQGLGMACDEMARANDLLRDPPDLGVLHLSSDSRLGMIVVALLAVRTGIKVTLTESDYGGVRAIVLIPSQLTENMPTESSVDLKTVETAWDTGQFQSARSENLFVVPPAAE
ncbi:nitrate- and nitrite sensing domain-containing protein [Nocardia salmonicida]|uniref:sensor histidine kinase n=1 Tax=Nocardia salmonicida TaxID=53431 RepID=UPI0036729058